MSNDMKLIMENWRSALSEQFAARAMMAQGEAKASFDASKAISDFYEWYDEQDTSIRILVDLFVPVAGQLVDIREAIEAYKRWEEWYLLDEDHPMKSGAVAERLDSEGAFLLTDAIIAVIFAIPGFDILEGVGLGYKQIKKALGGGSVSKKLRKLAKGSMSVAAPAALAYASMPYAMDSPDQKPQLGKDGIPIKKYSEGLPDEVIDEWKRKRDKQAREALRALDKLEAYEAEIQAKKKGSDSAEDLQNILDRTQAY